MTQMSIDHNEIDNEKQIFFAKAPSRLIIGLDNIVSEFCEATGFTVDSQQVNEITRQCFDIIGNGFLNYQEELRKYPLIGRLIENQKYVDSYGFASSAMANLKSATYSYGLGIYFACNYHGIFLGQQTPYMLEHMKGNSCLLLNASNLPR